MAKTKIAGANALRNGQTLKFEFSRSGRKCEGFVARFEGKLVAYENICRHLPVHLDYGGTHFFTSDKRHFACQAHHALYEPLTGLCVQGPCEGESLKPLAFEIVDGEVWLT